MKKQLLLIGFLSLASIYLSIAQIQLTSADVAGAYRIIYQANDTTPTISIGNAGASQSWDFSDLHLQTRDTLNFLPYSYMPNPKFSTANLIVKQGWQNNYSYLNLTTSSLKSLGNSGAVDLGTGPFNINQINTPAEILLNFPTAFNSGFTNNYVQKVKTYVGQTVQGVQVDSIRFKSDVLKTQTVDAWGSLISPIGTYNVLRIKETKINYDTIDAYIVVFPPIGLWQNAISTNYDSVTTYTYWANGLDFPLATVNFDITGVMTNVQWMSSLPINGINEFVAESSVLVYPNPAKDFITIEIENKKTTQVQVVDITGKSIAIINVTSSKQTLNTSDFSNGVYTYTLIDSNKNTLNRGRFVIAK